MNAETKKPDGGTAKSSGARRRTTRAKAPKPEEVETKEEAPAAEVAAKDGARPEIEAASRSADERIAQLEQELADAKDRYLRALAEAENVRKRSERDRLDGVKYGGVPLARNLLDVHDALDRFVATIDEDFRKSAPQFAEGVELIRRQLLSAFEKHEIRQICPQKGEAFDPNQHQAMFKEIDEAVTPGHVVRVLDKGFTLADRLLRAATVSVADTVPAPAKEKPATVATAKDPGEADEEDSGAEEAESG